MRIVIVGAGVAGCIMAKSLSKLPGAEVICLERVSADDQSDSGTGLNIGPNSVRALQWHDPDLLAQMDGTSFKWESWRTSLTDGTVLFHLPLAKVADNPGRRIRWSELYRVLRESAGAVVAYDCDITRVARSDSNPAQSTIEWTQNGAAKRLDRIDLLIAADGRYSNVRRAISGEPEIKHVGIAISRVLVSDDSGGLIDDYEQWFNGPNRLLAFRVPPGHIYVAGAFPIAPEKPIPDAMKAAPALRAMFSPASGKPSDQSVWLIDTICREAANNHWARMQEHDVLYADPACNVLYLGDAAHGMVPTLGQGANQAIEDACIAADHIVSAYLNGSRSPRAWLMAISHARSERVRFVMDFSLAASDTMMEGADPVAGSLHKTEADFLAKLSRVYRGGPGPDREPTSHPLKGVA
ncbi:FAD-dependent monooxygenase [Pseudorhodoplanes sp.]|uniref:FAD-dependent monooxygenase n=1 Tax=Pseudorhodoplanes sp. TaxID=1934341 RepID=UPI002B963961|nr:FAD-dependent monooxygenase [Pseudorhodoplanes sp.]HWV51498.1 FAD-dependent monooxygenase [Pseudorhodoplanes sp.]